MKNCFIGSLLVACMILLPLGAFAQVPTHIVYTFSGTGNFMVSPVVYTGSIDTGEPMLVGGTWDIMVDDTGWPADTDKAARWAYIDANYYAPNYDPFTPGWTGVFDGTSTANDPIWHASSAFGTLNGTAILQITLIDFDFDAVIDPDERGFGVYSGTIIVIKDGTGIWAGYCGLGSYSGDMQNPDPWNWGDDIVTGNTILDIEDCSIPTESITWGQVKELYSE
jgi:hypothetical protein